MILPKCRTFYVVLEKGHGTEKKGMALKKKGMTLEEKGMARRHAITG